MQGPELTDKDWPSAKWRAQDKKFKTERTQRRTQLIVSMQNGRELIDMYPVKTSQLWIETQVRRPSTESVDNEIQGEICVL